jgi:hypothetical protein
MNELLSFTPQQRVKLLKAMRGAVNVLTSPEFSDLLSE